MTCKSSRTFLTVCFVHVNFKSVSWVGGDSKRVCGLTVYFAKMARRSPLVAAILGSRRRVGRFESRASFLAKAVGERWRWRRDSPWDAI